MTTGILGHIVSWRVPATISLSRLTAALHAAGLDPTLAGDLLPRHVLTRALNDMKDGRVICRFRKTDESTVCFQLTKQVSNESGVEYERDATVTLNLLTNAIVADDSLTEQRARDLVVEHTEKRITNDITKIIQAVYNKYTADLIPIREQGGAYFVPASHATLVAQTRTFLNAIEGRLSSFEVKLGGEETELSVADSMSEYLSTLIGEFRASCEGINADSREDVIARRQARVAELRRRLECYKGLLGSYAETIGDAITSAEQTLLDSLMTSVSGGEAASAPAAQMGLGF